MAFNGNMEGVSSPQKRKRTFSSSLETNPDQIRLRTNIPLASPSGRGEEQQSPRTAVSYRMNRLALERASPSPAVDHNTAQHAASDGTGEQPGSGLPSDAEEGDDNNIVPVDLAGIFATSSFTAKKKPLRDRVATPVTPDSPVTPQLAPIPSPAAGPMVSPLRSTSSTPSPGPIFQRELLPIRPHQAEQSVGSPVGEPRAIKPLRTSSSPRPTTVEAKSARLFRTESSPGKGLAESPRTPKQRRTKSPPPTTVVNDLVWTDAEITGHDPDDPDDDLTGINGIGFRPTPAMAEMRRAQRRKQVTEWKKREEAERRARRREARTLNDTVMSKNDGNGDDQEGRKVRFSEGE